MPRHIPGPSAGRSAVTVCWSIKGGSGTSVVSAALALSSPTPVTLIDLAGDLPAVLGLPEPEGPGLHEWLESDAPAAQLYDLSLGVSPGVTLIPTGRPSANGSTADGWRGDRPDRAWQHDRWDDVLDALTSDDHSVLIDSGTGLPPEALHRLADRSLLVTRACYLSLRRAVAAPIRPTGIVLVSEPGRALRATDVEAAVGAPVLATVAVDPAIARAVDAGLLTARVPRLMERDLRGVAA